MSTGGLGGGGANAVKSVQLKAGGTRSYGYDASGNMTTDNAGFAAIYDHANLATKLQRGAVINVFTYGPNNAKARQTGSDGSKVYLGGFEDWITAGQTKVSLGNYAQITNGTGGRVLHYFLTDRLGSVDAVTDGNGNLIETRGHDAYGAPRTGVWADATQIQSTAITPKGFTGHEHLNSVQLIHMNGRMYDFQLGRFLGVDPFIQAPTNSQSLNPYSYINGNPLSGTDPTGYAGECPPKMQVCALKQNKLDALQAEVTSMGKGGMSASNVAGNKALSVARKIAANGELHRAAGGMTSGASSQSSMVADILSDLQQEPKPKFRMGALATKANAGLNYSFPIENVSVSTGPDGGQIIRGHFKIDGDTADHAVVHLRNSFNVNGTTANGMKWVLSFTFEVVTTGGDVHMNWMTPSDQRRLDREYGREYPNYESKNLLASTEMGSNSILFNPLYKSISSIEIGWNVGRTEAESIYNYFNSGTFAHEFSHGAGMDHNYNSTNAITSSAASRRVNNVDRIAWCHLASSNMGC